MVKIQAPQAPACSQRATMMFHGKRCVKADVRRVGRLMSETSIDWEAKIALLARGYIDGDQAVTQRSAMWPSIATDIILPALEQARDLLLKHAGSPYLIGASARRFILLEGGPDGEPVMESVQLCTGSSRTLGLLNKSNPVIETGASLGYSLGINGHVARWHIDHWLQGFESNSNQRMVLDEIYEDAASLSIDLIRRHVADFLKYALSTSYRGSRRAGLGIGFANPKIIPAQTD